jgi:ribonuclease HI
VNEFVLHFDGACWPNPGGTATFGWVLLTPFGARIASGAGVAAQGVGATNNVGEYAALEAGLAYLVGCDLDPTAVVVRGDSQLVVYQMTGKWACNKPHLAAFISRCRDLLRELRSNSWTARLEWVNRDANAVADALSVAEWERVNNRKMPTFTKRPKRAW